MCLFRPGWKSSDENKARIAVLKLPKGRKRTEKAVREIIATDERKSVIDAAFSVCCDTDYKKMIYETYSKTFETTLKEYISNSALSSIKDDPEYVINAIIASRRPSANAVNGINGDKEFAYGVLSKEIKLSCPLPPKDFLLELVMIIFRRSDETDRERMYKLICNLHENDDYPFINAATRYFEMKHDRNVLLKLAGEGVISQRILQTYFDSDPDSPTRYTVDDYKKLCARNVLKKWNIVSEAWNTIVKKEEN